MSKKRRRKKRAKNRKENTDGRKFIESFTEIANRSRTMETRSTVMLWLKEMKADELEELWEIIKPAEEPEKEEWSPIAMMLTERMYCWEMGMMPAEEMTQSYLNTIDVARIEASMVVKFMAWQKRGWIEMEVPKKVFAQPKIVKGMLQGGRRDWDLKVTEQGKEAGVEKLLEQMN